MTCKFCNTQIADESKVCSSCGKNLVENVEAPEVVAGAEEPTAAEPAQEAPQPAPSPAPAPAPQAAPGATPPPPAAPKAAPDPMVSDAVKILKGVFSKNPMEGARIASQTLSHAWLILAGAFILFSGLLNMFSVRAVRVDLGIFGSVSIGAGVRVGAFFGGMLSAAITVGVMALLILALFAILKIKVPFTRIINLVSASTLLYAATILIAILLPFFSQAGMILMYLMLFYAIKTYFDEKVTFLWAFGVIFVMALLYNGVSPITFGSSYNPFNWGNVWGF
ncbi:MAG: hypothetical protein FWC69_04890 [Defluviitaleaceae bacterium]|nr:hypothetical protein [Defluviitaleaceae bacterium]